MTACYYRSGPRRAWTLLGVFASFDDAWAAAARSTRRHVDLWFAAFPGLGYHPFPLFPAAMRTRRPD